MLVNKYILTQRAHAQTRAHFHTCVYIQCIFIILVITMHADIMASDEAKPSADIVLIIKKVLFVIQNGP